MKISRVEKLGDVIAFRPKSIEVRGVEYDAIPEEKLEDFEVVCNNTKAAYEKAIAAAKSKGEKVSPRAIKGKVVDEVLMPFLANFIQAPVKVVREIKSKEPGIKLPKDSIKVEVTKEDIELAKRFYDNNFDSSVLDDSVEDSNNVVELGDVDSSFISDDEDFVIEGL